MATTIKQQAFLVTVDVPEIYIQEFWATATVHQHSIRFKMDTRKHIVDLEAFREMLHISPRIPGQSFAELPFEDEILEFLRFLGHSAQIKTLTDVNVNKLYQPWRSFAAVINNAQIKTLTDVNVNKLYQPWRSFAAVINKCLTGKSTGFDSFSLSQAQILWGFYHRRNVDYAFLIWEDLVYQVEHKNQKKSNEIQETHISQQRGSGTDEGTGSKPGVPDGESEGESDEEETRQEEEGSFDPIP
nr:hypothetical protein [Tanacetum cinerariifolium]